MTRKQVSTHTITVTKLVIAVLVVAGIGLAKSPVALADGQMFLNEVREKVDYPLTDAQAFQLGRVACQALREGINSGLTMGKSRAKADSAIGRAQNDMGLSMDPAHGMFLTEAAEHQLC